MIIVFMVCPLEQINKKLREEARLYANEHLKQDGIVIDLAGWKDEQDIMKILARGLRMMDRSDAVLYYGNWNNDMLCKMLSNAALEKNIPIIGKLRE